MANMTLRVRGSSSLFWAWELKLLTARVMIFRGTAALEVCKLRIQYILEVQKSTLFNYWFVQEDIHTSSIHRIYHDFPSFKVWAKQSAADIVKVTNMGEDWRDGRWLYLLLTCTRKFQFSQSLQIKNKFDCCFLPLLYLIFLPLLYLNVFLYEGPSWLCCTITVLIWSMLRICKRVTLLWTVPRHLILRRWTKKLCFFFLIISTLIFALLSFYF